jgi:DNA polymerase (family X)
MGNLEVAKLFRNVAAAYAIKDAKKFYFQMLAYQKASEVIKSTTSELKDLYKEGKLETLPGIGVTIRSRLEELFKTGSVFHFNAVFKDIPEAVFRLINVPTIGPKTAYKLAKELRLNNPKTALDELILKAKNHEIAKIPGFGEKSEQDILRAISEYKEGKGKTTRMVLPYAAEIADKMLDYLKQLPSIVKAVPLGSLRRMTPTIGDIDIAVATNEPEKAIEHFVSYPYRERVIEKGPESASILTSGGKQIDLMVQPVDGFGALLQHFTGSKDHNVHLREYALKKGLSLSEKGIKRQMADGKWHKDKYATEKKFYNALGMEWIPPEIRENKGEIELALAHNLPKLIELADIKGDLHIHSSFPIEPSHDLGQTKMEEMIKYARKLNYEYLGFSEHNPSVSNHTNDNIYALIARRNDNIEQIMSSTKDVRIIKMLEVDILSSGKLAVDDRSLQLLDGAIVSIHSSFSMSKTEMTKRVLSGLSHPKAKILAHPTGRMLNERSGYELDFDQIFDLCKKHNKALEINSWPERLDLPDSLIKEAIENGIKLVIDTDSHEVSQMNLIRYGVAMARRGWAKKSDIINGLEYNDLIRWLRR